VTGDKLTPAEASASIASRLDPIVLPCFDG
jgi:hypothetical protein